MEARNHHEGRRRSGFSRSRFDARRQTARLLVDGVERLRDYRGHREYLEGRGLIMSTALYRSARAEIMVKRVRFEINP